MQHFSADQLRQFIERIERLEEEKKGIQDDIKDVFLEAKATGFEPKIMKQVIRLRKLDKPELDETEFLLEAYKSALGIVTSYAQEAEPEDMAA
jgi:uncharacterized protein (UPF0335 family)